MPGRAGAWSPDQERGFQEPTISFFGGHGASYARGTKHPLDRELHSPTENPAKSTSEPPLSLGLLLLQPPPRKKGPAQGGRCLELPPPVPLHRGHPHPCAQLHLCEWPVATFVKPLTYFLAEPVFIHPSRQQNISRAPTVCHARWPPFGCQTDQAPAPMKGTL